METKYKMMNINWENPIEFIGTPNEFPVLARYNTNDFKIHIRLDPYSYSNKNIKLVWIHIKIGNYIHISKNRLISYSYIDSPTNRPNIEKIYQQTIYSLLKNTNKPKIVEPYIKKIVQSLELKELKELKEQRIGELKN